MRLIARYEAHIAELETELAALKQENEDFRSLQVYKNFEAELAARDSLLDQMGDREEALQAELTMVAEAWQYTKRKWEAVIARLKRSEAEVERLRWMLKFCYNPDGLLLGYWNPVVEECYQNWLADLSSRYEEAHHD